MELPPFLIERLFAEHEFTARANLTGSDVEGIGLHEFWTLAPHETRQWYEGLTLGYTESPGHPRLRDLVADASGLASGSAVQVFAGATEAVFVLLNVALRPGDHVVVLGPTYQLLTGVPRAIGAAVTEVRLRREDGWRLDMPRVRAAVRPNTRLIVANFPQNPTGALPARQAFDELIDLVDGSGMLLLSDEIYRGVELDPADRLPVAASLTPNAVSVSGVSKVFGMAGVRVGWTLTQDSALAADLLDYRYWTSLATSAPSEVLAIGAFQAAPLLLERAQQIVRTNREALARFVESSSGWQWVPPVGGTCAYPWLTSGSASEFSRWLVAQHGLLLAPDVMFDHSGEHLRFGLGRRDAFAEGMATLAQAWREWTGACP